MQTYDISPQEVSVKIGDKEYIIRETSEHAISKWKNSQFAKVELRDGKPVKIADPANGDSFLLSLCLFEITNDNHRNLVDIDVIRSWPSRVVDELVKIVKDISGITEGPPPEPCEKCGHVKDEDDAKKKSKESSVVSD